MSLLDKIAADIEHHNNAPFTIENQQTVGGGCINAAARITGTDGDSYFVKTNRSDALAMFEAEADGLRELKRSNSVRVPEVIATGNDGDTAYLVLEYIALRSRGGHGQAMLGEQLANMHRFKSDHFGWHRDNTIGSTPQPNTPANDWIAFWRERRLGFQLELAARKGYGSKLQKLGERCQADLHDWLSQHNPIPSLLHGDLWSGNYGFTSDNEPVVFDPAVYYGDREADLAMTELFGGFSRDFYAAYNAAFPLEDGYEWRKDLYNLYHVLNHLNLFGGGYHAQAISIMERLLANTA